MIGFTSGCFDILHLGHLQFLKAVGGFMRSREGFFYIALNTDASIRRLKGVSRPINSYDIRYQQLKILPWVDDVIPLDDDTPREMVSKMKPDYFFKTDNYTVRDIENVLIDYEGTIVLLPFGADISTTKIVDKINENIIDR
jgi:rfaE bifunctional protein nucleotidyltransferase chain/domain